MATRGVSSKNEKDRNFVEGEFRKGVPPNVVARENPDIPRSTIYKWYKDEDWKKPKQSPLHVVAPISNVHLDAKSKLDKLEEILWYHASNPSELTSSVVRSCQCLLKVFEARESESSEHLTDTERTERINQILEAARTRRARQSFDSEAE